MSVRELLLDTYVHIPPRHALDPLSAVDATRRVPGAPHTIAEIVAHMAFWQTWLFARCRGMGVPMATSAAIGWPPAAADGWEELRESFFDELERAVALGADPSQLDAPLAPAIDFPPLAHYCVRDALVHVAAHNAHHLGQIITLRQQMGQWPPPSGSWTW